MYDWDKVVERDLRREKPVCAADGYVGEREKLGPWRRGV